MSRQPSLRPAAPTPSASYRAVDQAIVAPPRYMASLLPHPPSSLYQQSVLVVYVYHVAKQCAAKHDGFAMYCDTPGRPHGRPEPPLWVTREVCGCVAVWQLRGGLINNVYLQIARSHNPARQTMARRDSIYMCMELRLPRVWSDTE